MSGGVFDAQYLLIVLDKEDNEDGFQYTECSQKQDAKTGEYYRIACPIEGMPDGDKYHMDGYVKFEDVLSIALNHYNEVNERLATQQSI